MKDEIEDVEDGCVCGTINGTRWVADTKGKLVFVSPVTDAERFRVASLASRHFARRDGIEDATRVLQHHLPLRGRVTVIVGDVGSGVHGYAEEHDGEMLIRLAPRRWRGLLDALAHEWAHLRVWEQTISEANHGPVWRSEMKNARRALKLDK